MSWKDDPGRKVLLEAQRKPNSGGTKRSSGGKKGRAARPTGLRAVLTFGQKAATGGILAMLAWVIAGQLGAHTLPLPLGFHQFSGAALVGGLIGVTPLRWILWVVTGLECLLFLVIGYTPLIKAPTQALVRVDALRKADAVVVLSSSVRATGEMDSAFQVRVLHGYEVIRQGFAPRLVVTRLERRIARHSAVPAVKKQLGLLRLDIPIDEVGPVSNTHDEATQVAQLVGERGWKRVILVSDPTHMRRAGATFARAGVTVIRSPCRNPDYDLVNIRHAGDRLRAFQDWFHETLGYVEYRRRGWL